MFQRGNFLPTWSPAWTVDMSPKSLRQQRTDSNLVHLLIASSRFYFQIEKQMLEPQKLASLLPLRCAFFLATSLQFWCPVEQPSQPYLVAFRAFSMSKVVCPCWDVPCTGLLRATNLKIWKGYCKSTLFLIRGLGHILEPLQASKKLNQESLEKTWNSPTSLNILKESNQFPSRTCAPDSKNTSNCDSKINQFGIVWTFYQIAPKRQYSCHSPTIESPTLNHFLQTAVSHAIPAQNFGSASPPKQGCIVFLEQVFCFWNWMPWTFFQTELCLWLHDTQHRCGSCILDVAIVIIEKHLGKAARPWFGIDDLISTAIWQCNIWRSDVVHAVVLVSMYCSTVRYYWMSWPLYFAFGNCQIVLRMTRMGVAKSLKMK